MAMFVAAKFNPGEMPTIYDPGPLQDLRPEEFVVVPRSDTEDVAIVAALEHKSVHQLKLRRKPYPRVIRRAEPAEVELWWERKTQERRALVIAKEKALEFKLDIKISHVRFDPKDNKAVYHFTSDQRVDFRALVKDLSAILKMRIELWQIGVRDEARMIDGFGVCGLQTCCSTWLTEFRPITIRMAKDQDINLPPTKLSGQCGRLLCCLSYEADQYRAANKRAFPKGATVKWNGVDVVVVDRNVIAGTYQVAEASGVVHAIKHEDIEGGDARIPDQMRREGKKILKDRGGRGKQVVDSMPGGEPVEAATAPSPEAPSPEETKDAPRPDGDSGKGRRKRRRGGRGRRRGPEGETLTGQAQGSSASSQPGSDVAPAGSEADGEKKSGRRRKRGRRR